jgi:hypothetical protein
VEEQAGYRDSLRGFTYKTYYQAFGTTLESTAKKAIKELGL